MTVQAATAVTAKPTPLQVAPGNIPQSLKDLRQWVVWRYSFKDGKWTKPPFRVDGNGCRDHASSTDPATWADFPAALNAHQNKNSADGIGIVLTVDMGIVGVDLDHCYDRETKSFEPWATAIIDHFDSYTEASPSGTGVRIFLKGKLPAGGRKKGNIEIYSSGRYLTVTGRVLKKEKARVIEPRQEQIDAFLLEHFPSEPKPENRSGANGATHLSDHEILEIGFCAKNGDKLRSLLDGDLNGYPSQSEAELALCSLLAFYADDAGQIDRIYRGSKLYREKWDQKHYGDGQTYGERTIEKAIAGTTEHYTRHETGKPLQGNDLPVSCLEEISDEPAAAVAFPEAAWTGLFATWRDTIAPRTEAPLEFLWAAFLLAVGMVIGRNAFRESPNPVYPNYYLLFLGPTGDSRKSTALNYARDVLRHVGEEFKDLSGVVSSEGIYEALAGREGAKGLIYADEFRALLSVARRKGTQDIIPKLNTLYSCPARDSIDRVKDSTEIINPFVSLVAATPKAYIEDVLSCLEIEGGFINRFMIIAGEEQPPKSLARRLPPIPWEKFTTPLARIRDQEIGHLDFTEEAITLYDDFYRKWRTERRTWSHQHANLTSRVFEHVLKIATVYTVLAGDRQINTKTLAIAIAIGEWIQSNARNIFADIGLDQFGKCERIILDVLKRGKDHRMWRRDLQRAMSARGFNGEIFNRAIKALESNDHVRCYKVTTASGKERPVVELSL